MRKDSLLRGCALVLALCLFAGTAFAVPLLLPVQGKLQGNNVNDVNQTLPMRFVFYNAASGGAALWDVNRVVDVNVVDTNNFIGVFTVLLGENGLLDINSSTDYNYLGIQIQFNEEMAPRIRLASAPYAFYAVRSENADLLDGNNSLYYTNADNINAGTLSASLYADTNAASECSDTNSVLNADGECIVISDFYLNDGGAGTDNHSPNVLPWADVNVADNITVAWAGLTGVPIDIITLYTATNPVRIDANVVSLVSDFNSSIENLIYQFDSNGASLPSDYNSVIEDLIYQFDSNGAGTDNHSPNVLPWADANVADNITVAWAGLTGVPVDIITLYTATNPVRIDANVVSLVTDYNSVIESLIYQFDTNGAGVDTAYPNVIPWADVNVADDLTIAWAGLTGVPVDIITSYTATLPIRIDANVVSLATDYNSTIESLIYQFDTNGAGVDNHSPNVLPWADANVADNITVGWAGLTGVPVDITTTYSATAPVVVDLNVVSLITDFNSLIESLIYQFDTNGAGTDNHSPNVLPWADANVADDITVAWAGLTGVPVDITTTYTAKGPVTIDLNIVSLITDFNSLIESLIYQFDTNAGGSDTDTIRTYTSGTNIAVDSDANTVSTIADFNTMIEELIYQFDTNAASGFTEADANGIYVPYLGADYDLNMGTYAVKAFNDVNAKTVFVGETMLDSNSTHFCIGGC